MVSKRIMAYVISFSSLSNFQTASDYFLASPKYAEILNVPEFCKGLILPSLLVAGTRERLLLETTELGVQPCGVVRYSPFDKDSPAGASPNEVWRSILGAVKLTVMRQSVSDPQKLHAEISVGKDLGLLIPFMASLIKGGAYRPDVPSLAVEEGHRIIVFFPGEIIISRADNLLDFWINVRRSIDLICEAQEKRSFLVPVVEPRHGISAIEIFRRLPATNCGQCGKPNCMEFAVAVFTGKTDPEDCPSLGDEAWSEHRKSACRLVKAIGVVRNHPH